MRLKTYEHKTIEKKTDIELPAYFYIQGELFDDEYIRINEEGKTIISYKHRGFNVEFKAKDYFVPPHWIGRCSTTEEDFEEALFNCVGKITSNYSSKYKKHV